MKKAIVFGASSELGVSISDRLCKQYLVTRASSAFLKSINENFSYLSATSASLDSLNIQLKSFDVFVFNQAMTVLSDLLTLDRAQVTDSYIVNVVFPLEVIKHVLASSSDFHRFIFISSVAGTSRSESASVAYSSSKRAIHGLVKHLSFEYGCQSDFIAVAPSQIDSKSLRENLSAKQISVFKDKNPTGQLCTVEEISYLVACIAAYPGRHLNGSIVDLNGGIL